ncbi:phosphate ABC transporter permease PstA [Halomicrobium urmianum]|uniref:phosphate ABC transporter permease PstA n=1 Tax=Halomicrobium urmianum TaxID=1586233 RepID=UPI001CD9B591|nr:phosphate ABC transporter permease PstA [Halomicrobium urmianum]
MSDVEAPALVRERGTAGESLATALLAVAALGFLAGWAALFQWLDEGSAPLGVGLFDWLGGALAVLGVGLVAVGLAARLGYVDATPSPSAGVPVAVVYGLLWSAGGGSVGVALFGAAPIWLPLALAAGAAGSGVALFAREDLGATAPAAAVLVPAGVAVAAGPIGPGWTWEPAWSSAVFPGSELAPILVVAGSVLGAWVAAKARDGFGARGRETGARVLVGTVVFGTLGVLALLIGFIVVNGLGAVLTGASLNGGRLTVPVIGVALPWIEVPFLTNVTGGLFVDVPGVLPAVVGTLWLVAGAVAFAVPLGVGAAVFLTEYAERGRFTQVVEVATNGLWSTPSIVFGLFGLAFLVPRISGGNSILVGQLVLGFMLLPLVLITSRESLKSVPDEYRDASAALGVSKWQTIRSAVLPAAMPGTITGTILGVGRIAGETAPLLLVFGGAPYPNSTPDVLGSFELTAQPPFVTNEALLSPASALPYQLYSTITAGVFPKEVFTNQEFGWGTALVLLLVVIGLYAIGVASRLYFRRKLHE